MVFIIFWIILFCRPLRRLQWGQGKTETFPESVSVSSQQNLQALQKWEGNENIILQKNWNIMKLTTRQLCILMLVSWNLKIFRHLAEMFNALLPGVFPRAGCKCKFRTFYRDKDCFERASPRTSSTITLSDILDVTKIQPKHVILNTLKAVDQNNFFSLTTKHCKLLLI